MTAAPAKQGGAAITKVNSRQTADSPLEQIDDQSLPRPSSRQVSTHNAPIWSVPPDPGMMTTDVQNEAGVCAPAVKDFGPEPFGAHY